VRRSAKVAGLLVAVAAIARCGDDSVGTDGGADSGVDATLDAPADAPKDAAAESTADAGADAAADAPADVVIDYALAHAYLGTYKFSVASPLLVYDLPLSASSAPTLSLGVSNSVFGAHSVRMQPDGARLWVIDENADRLRAFDLPLTASSQPAINVLLTTISPEDGVFDSAGNLWVVGTAVNVGRLEKYAAPITSTSQPAFTITTTGPAHAIGIDGSGNLYVSGSGGIQVFTAPVTSTSSPAFTNAAVSLSTGFALDQSHLYVSDPANHAVSQLDLPINASSTASATLSGPNAPWHLAFSETGDLAVADEEAGLVVLSAPSFSTVAFTVSTGDAGGTVPGRGIAFGP
jgi:hypothetical protein